MEITFTLQVPLLGFLSIGFRVTDAIIGTFSIDQKNRVYGKYQRGPNSVWQNFVWFDGYILVRFQQRHQTSKAFSINGKQEIKQWRQRIFEGPCSNFADWS